MADPTSFLNGRVTLHAGDCLAVLPTLAENSVDSVVTDPPYHLASIVKRWSGNGPPPVEGVYRRSTSGFMNRIWDGGDIAFQVQTWAEVLRVLKPGGYILAFSSTRTFGRMSVAIEDAGFITHPFIAWIFGSGFPKAHNASKAIDRELGAERKIVGVDAPKLRPNRDKYLLADQPGGGGRLKADNGATITASATEEARQWDGWAYGGQALKPAIEPIYMGQKPFSEKNGALNILKHGVGAINIDGCRVEGSAGTRIEDKPRNGGVLAGNQTRPYIECAIDAGEPARPTYETHSAGRWPANVILSDDEEVQSTFPETSSQPFIENDPGDALHGGGIRKRSAGGFSDAGSAARFFYQVKPDASRLFYSSKADSEDRAGSRHPTVKPLDLMQYLVRLVTPPCGKILDPFAGTGTTAEAAWREGFSAILIEREPEYLADIERRMGLCLAGPDERARESIKARLKGKAEDHGPLFSTPSLFDEADAA